MHALIHLKFLLDLERLYAALYNYTVFTVCKAEIVFTSQPGIFLCVYGFDYVAK